MAMLRRKHFTAPLLIKLEISVAIPCRHMKHCVQAHRTATHKCILEELVAESAVVSEFREGNHLTNFLDANYISLNKSNNFKMNYEFL
jgi:hypothetical protein